MGAPAVELEPAVTRGVRHAGAMIVLSAVAGAILVGGFGWDTAETVIGAVLGALFFAPIWFFLFLRETLPSGDLQAAPEEAVIERRPWRASRGEALALAVSLGLCFPLAWVADRLDAAAAVVPGQFLGYALANGVWVVRIRRWERAHGRRVLTETEGGEKPAIYAR